MNNFILESILIALILILVNCDTNTTEPNGRKSFISVTGDTEESYQAEAYFDVGTWTSGNNVKKYLTIMIMPLSKGNNPLAMALLFKSNPELPQTGSFVIGEYGFGFDIPENEFGGSYSGQNVTDNSMYTMKAGTLTITEASNLNISGEFESTGYYVKLLERDTTKIVNIIGNFNAAPYQRK